MKKISLLTFLALFLFIHYSSISAETISAEMGVLRIDASLSHSSEVEMEWSDVMLHGLSLALPGAQHRTDDWPFYGYSLSDVKANNICNSDFPFADSKVGDSISFVVPDHENHQRYIGWNIRLQKKNENDLNISLRYRDLCSVIQSQEVLAFMAEELYKSIGQSVQKEDEWYLLTDEPIMVMDFVGDLQYMSKPQTLKL